ncbi:MAG: hypothetical protein LQ342_003734 [Letrouitia transgressa]|nr:MAG: hypothetical protein LQ342_003734 [Letrouitia transgressa]
MTPTLYCRAIIPIGVLYSLSLVCSNFPYLYLSVAFIQMLKGTAPVAVLLASWSLRLDKPSTAVFLNMLFIVLGIVIASMGEIRFMLNGFLYQMGGIVFEAYRLALIQRLLNSEKYKMDPLVSLYYFAPVCAGMILLMALVFEVPTANLAELEKVGPHLIVANAGAAFLLNVASVFLIGKTSSLVLTLCGVLKNILLIGASIVIWGTVVTPMQFFGNGMAMSGLVYYKVGATKLHAALLKPVSETIAKAPRAIKTAAITVLACLLVGLAGMGFVAARGTGRNTRGWWENIAP